MDLNSIYTPKQIVVLKACRANDWFMLINHGAKRSGKTQLDNDLFLQELMRVKGTANNLGIDTPQYILAGYSLGNIQDNILTELSNKYGFEFKFDKYNNFHHNQAAAHAIVNASFHNARYSDRIWMYQDMMKAELSKLLQSGLIQGKNPRELARHIEKLFGVRKSDAVRLMRSELARVQTEAQKQSFERNGYEQYEFIALGSACEVCRVIDGEIFEVKKMMSGENAPPMHPNCRCSTAAYVDRKEFDKWLSEKEELKLSDTTDKWAKEARKELFHDEKSLARRSKEAAVIYDVKGNYLFTKRGGETEIRFTKAEARRMEGGIVTHNHPSNASFSMADWKTFKNAKLSEIRVATNDGTYYLRCKEKGTEWEISDEELEKEYKKIRHDIKSKYQDMYKRGMIEKTERFILSSDEYNRLFAEKNGFEYGKEMYDE